MKRNLKALLMASALALSLVVASPMAALAAQYSDMDAVAGADNPSVIKNTDGTTQNYIDELDIDVQAQILGSMDKIVYSIHIEYGEMKFIYDFGQTWDPLTHTYSTPESGISTGGWVKSALDGSNNQIKITNDSNYPICAEFRYEATASGTGNRGTLFNSNINSAGAVIGIFSKNNATLKDNINTADYQGVGSTAGNTLTTLSMDLDMDYSRLTFGSYEDYGVLDVSGSELSRSGVYEDAVYFSLCGKPDSTAALTTDFTSVGTIKVKISPSSNVTTREIIEQRKQAAAGTP